MKFLVRNQATHTEITEAEFLVLSGQYLTRELTSTTLQQFVAIFESFLYETMRTWMLAYPKSLSRRLLSGEDIFSLPDKAAIVNALVEKELKDLFYDRPANWFDRIEDLVKIGVPSSDDKMKFGEIKATRDVLVHGHGIANAYYVENAGHAARAKSSEPLDVTEPYHQASWELIYRLTNEIGDALAAKAP